MYGRKDERSEVMTTNEVRMSEKKEKRKKKRKRKRKKKKKKWRAIRAIKIIYYLLSIHEKKLWKQ